MKEEINKGAGDCGRENGKMDGLGRERCGE